MKKLIIPIIALLMIVGIANAQNTLYEWYQGKLPSISERAKVYKNISSGEYSGTFLQNVQLLKHLRGGYLQVLENPYTEKEADEEMLSGQRPSDYKTTLAESLTSTASTTENISVSSVTTKDGHALTTADVGDFICLKINPGASNQELICCSGGISGTEFLDCSRGYSLYQNAVEGSKEKTHSPGETVIISNDDAYLQEQYAAKDTDNTIYGTWTFASTTAISRINIGNGAITYDKAIYAYNGETNLPYLVYDESANTWSFSNDGVSSTAIGSGASVYTANVPIDITSSVVSLSTSTTDFVLDGSGDLSIRKNGSITSNADGLAVATTSDFSWTGTHSFSGANTFSATSTFSANLIADGFVKAYTALEGISAMDAVIATSTATTTSQMVAVADASNASTTYSFIGFALTSAAGGETVYVQTSGEVSGFTGGLTTTTVYFISDTAGEISDSSGTVEGIVGLATDYDTINLDTRANYGLQYVGSMSITTSATTSVPYTAARFAIIQVSVSGTNCDGKGTITIARTGITSAVFYEESEVNIYCSGTYTWVAGGITNAVAASDSPTQSATAYFYR